MKKLFVLCLFFLGMTAFAQEHMTFKGIPIDGTKERFCRALEGKGFQFGGKTGSTIVYTGTFAGYDECMIAVYSMTRTNLVYGVGVLFPKENDWDSLNNDYMRLKESLNKKYGNPVMCVEDFENDVVTSTSDMKLHETLMGRCKYECIYKNESGEVVLRIIGDYLDGCRVVLSYADSENRLKFNEESMEDL